VRSMGEEGMESGEFGSRLRELRSAGHWTQKALGRHLAEEARRLGRPIPAVPASTISIWENGRRYPDHLHAYLLCSTLGVSPEALCLEHLLSAEVVAQIESSLAATRRPGPVGPPNAVQAPGYDRLPGLGGAGGDWERLAFVLNATRKLDVAAVSDLRQLTNWYLESRLRIGPRQLLPALHAHLASLRSLIPLAESSSIRREVARMAGEVAVAAGQNWHVLHDYGETLVAFRFALELAHEMEDQQLRAMALISRAMIYTSRLHDDEGIAANPGATVDMLREAERAIGPRASSRMRLWLYCERSWELAGAGFPCEAQRDLELGERALAQVVSGPAGGFLAPWDANYLTVCRGKVAMLLGELPVAIGLLSRAVDEAADDNKRPFWVVQLAIACARAKEPERASALLASAVDGVITAGSGMLIRRVAKITRRELAIYRHQPAVRMLRERLEGQPVLE
jgi:transcriptional regulator with XRE-family HTH domain